MAQKTRLTVRVDRSALDRGKRYAASNNTSLSKLISDFLGILDSEANPPQTPILRQLSGILPAEASVEDHRALQAELPRRGWVAFVADGSLLARASGVDPRPRRDGREVAFESPPELRAEVDLPHVGRVGGMAVPAGVTLIVGGGFHGKSTLLQAIASGIDPHPPGDGRERVACLARSTTIQAEDGRSVQRADLSGFLGPMPSGVHADEFTSERASGSTSQAAAIVEALECDARLLLMDEDRCATNFMVRDGRMQRLVPRDGEPIMPFIDRVRELYDRFDLSTILVTGGSGDYLDVADTVVRMEGYLPRDVTAEARRIASSTATMRVREPWPPLVAPARREPLAPRAPAQGRMRGAARGPDAVRLGDETVDLRAITQLSEPGQLRALARLALRSAEICAPGLSVADVVAKLEHALDRDGLDALERTLAYDLARPAPLALAALLHRWRALSIQRP